MSSNKIIADVFLEVANAIESGDFGPKVKIGLTTLGSEHGVENLVKGAEMAKSKLFDIVLIGPKVDTDLEIVEVNDEAEMHKKMEELLDSKYIDACVTMHYNFPIGVSTVGRVLTPGRGKEMILATTTGTSATNRIEAMIRNAVYGISAAKSIGIKAPKVGILNVDGARQVEKYLKELQANGYGIEFAESIRADGGCVMRGNDLLAGTPDVMVTDTLTGNLLMKVFSSFTTGGDFESQGFGYGPGVGEDYERRVFIVSRASGSPVVANALKYAYEAVLGKVSDVARTEYSAAKAAGIDAIFASLNAKKEDKGEAEEVKMPDKEVVTHQISGVDIMELDDAVESLWKKGIYAESGMGCTGPIVLVNEAKGEEAAAHLKEAGFIA